MTYKLRNFVDAISESETAPQNSPFDRFVGLEHYDSGELEITRFSDTSLLSSSVKVFHKNDILIARRNVYLKRAGIVFFDGLTSGDSIILRVRPNCEVATSIPYSIALRWLPLILNSSVFWAYANKHADGMNSKRISKEMLLDYEFNAPSFEEIVSVTEKIWAAHELKNRYRNLLKATDEIVKSRFIEMYSKCQKNSLSSIASSWDKGQAFKKESIVDKGTTQCIHYGELFTKYGPIIDKVLSTTNEEAIKVSKKGDILFPASDVTPNGLARCSAVMLDKVLLGGDIIVLRLSDGVVPEYISYAINMQKEQLIRRVTGSVVRHLSSKNLASVTIPVPSLGEQVMFVKIIRKADKSKFELRQAIDKIDRVIRSLIG